MQKPILKLKEIIWEITGKCNNGCTYCGSKDQWKETIDEDKIIKIAKKIAEYPPEEIDISGGDPTLVSGETHAKIVKILKDAGVKCKMLINPKSIRTKDNGYFPEFSLVQLYDWIGLSVNTESELELAKIISYDKMTIISNFNTTNLYMFDYIKEFVKEKKLAWQIQMTMTDKEGEAIYKSDLAFNTLEQYMRTAVEEGVKLIPADNLNAGQCGAGIMSLGILANGDVVPCLSMRSWFKDIKEAVVGNLFEENYQYALEEIWLSKFDKIRFRGFHCCKDECGNRCVNLGMAPKPGAAKRAQIKIDTPLPPKQWPLDTRTVMYAVQTPPNVMAYAVFPNDSISLYAVSPSRGSAEITPVYSCFIPDEYSTDTKLLYGVTGSSYSWGTEDNKEDNDKKDKK